MTAQQQGPQPTQKQGQQFEKKHSSRIPWIAAGIVLAAILTFSLATLFILRNQGITQGTSTLTVLSIIAGVILGLLGFLFTFLQWFHSRYSEISHSPTIPSSPSQPLQDILPPSSSALPSLQVPLPTQAAQLLPIRETSPVDSSTIT